MANKLNKSTGLFGMGGGRRKGAKSKIGDALDQLRKKRKRKKLVKSNAKSKAKEVKDVYKDSKRESIKTYKGQGLSRGEAKDQIMKDSKAKVKSNRDNARKEITSRIDRTKTVKKNKKKPFVNINTESSVDRSREFKSKKRNSNSRAEAAVKLGEKYVRIMPDGTKKEVIKNTKERMDANKKNQSKAMHGAKVKAMKGSKVMYKDGGALKSVPSEAKGLSKLPTSVRNKMGYMKNGGKVKAMYGAKMKKAMYGAKMKKK